MVIIAEIRAVTSVPTWKVTDRQEGALIHGPEISLDGSDSQMTPSQLLRPPRPLGSEGKMIAVP